MLSSVLLSAGGFRFGDLFGAPKESVLDEQARIDHMLAKYRTTKISKAGVDLFCYSLDGDVSTFQGFEGHTFGSRTIIQGRDKRSYESAFTYVRLHRSDIIVADCLDQRDPSSAYLHHLIQNAACGIALDRINKESGALDDRITAVSVVGADGSLLRTLNRHYGSRGYNLVFVSS